MHSIKKAARHAAWYDDPNAETHVFSPVRRWHSKTQRPARDEEQGSDANGLREWPTENQAGPSTLETTRRQQLEPPSPQRANTFNGRPSAEFEHGRDDMTSSEDSKDTNEKSVPPTEPSQERPAGFVDQSVGQENGARKRKSRKFADMLSFKKKDKEQGEVEGEEVDRRGSSASKKKKKKRDTSHITLMSQFKAVFWSPINILFIAVPIGIAINYAGVNKVAVFVVNFIAIIPLAATLSYSTEELALYIGETLGGLLNATFGNAVELIVSIIALTQQKVLIVQTSLIGSMLSNLLLVQGMCFFFGGLHRVEQFFNLTVAQTAASLLALAIGALIIPTAFWIFAPGTTDDGVTKASRGVSVMLLFTYACYLIFQLRTHIDIYNAPSQKAPIKESHLKHKRAARKGTVSKGLAALGAGSGATMGGDIMPQTYDRDAQQDDNEDEPQLTILGALITLAVSTVLVALCAEYMVSSINAVAKSVSQEFIGLILLPIVGNAAEHVTAVTVAIKDKMDLAIGVAVGSSLQIALLVLPLMVCFNWFGLGSPSDLNLNFDGFQVTCLFIAIVVVNQVIADGKSHWLEGVLLQVVYLVIAVSAWFYPAQGDVAG